MKKSDLIKIIELVVRKEVKKQVNEIFIKENKSSLKSLAPKTKPKKVQKKEPVQYTSNKELNQVPANINKLIESAMECMDIDFANSAAKIHYQLDSTLRCG